MSKKENAIGSTNHPNGQVFYTKMATVFGTPSTFKSDARKVVNRLTGGIENLDEQVRVVVKVIDENGLPTALDAMTFEQLSVATAKRFSTPKDLKCLRGATVLFYVSDRKQGEAYYFRPDQPVDQKQVAQRSGEFTTLFGIEPTDNNLQMFDELPDYQGHATQTAEQAAELEEQAKTLQAELAAKQKATPEVEQKPTEESEGTGTKASKSK